MIKYDNMVTSNDDNGHTALFCETAIGEDRTQVRFIPKGDNQVLSNVGQSSTSILIGGNNRQYINEGLVY